MTRQELTEDASMPIAIVGMGFRGPGDATNVENLWKMISEGRESWSKIPKNRWNHDAFYHPDANRHGTYNVTGGHFLQQDVSQWDAPFFQMSAAEAAALDPQQRFLLESTYEAMENSGITMEQFCGSDTSVFAGAFTTDYTDILWRDPESTPMYQCTNSGQCRSNFANRLSYFFDLQGQSVDVDTACSTSLIGLHLGCQTLRTGEAKMSIVAGVNVILSHEAWVTMSMMRFLSPDGRCYSFDERANGYARGEGVGVLLLKPLSDALRDGDTVRAVIRGTGASQDGRTPGITMPNGVAQEKLIRGVYERSGLDPLGTSYVECHGTGTQAGDPLETRAVSRVFCEGRDSSSPIRIGSVKTNVGHLEATSGVAGVIKSVLMLENKVYLPNRNFKKANPRIPLEEWKLKVPLAIEPWEGPVPRRASVNSFGYGGAIAHVILESAEDYLKLRGYSGYYRTTKSLTSLAPKLEYTNGHSSGYSNGITNGHANGLSNGHSNGTANGHSNGNGHIEEVQNGARNLPEEDSARLFVLSSFDEHTSKLQVENLQRYLEDRADHVDQEFLKNLAYTLNERRTHHIWKTAVVGRSTKDLAQSLGSGVTFSSGGTKKRKLGFVFTGQGAQWCGMGKELISTYPLFRATVEKTSDCLKAAGAPFDVVDELTRDPMGSSINRALYSQPLCSAVQIALVDLLASFGIRPDSVTGHSSGEIAAAYAIGALSLEDAMRVAYFRGVASTSLAQKGIFKGSMMAVGLSKEDALPYLAKLVKGKAVVACSNSPSSVTISGDETAIDELLLILEEEKIFARKLIVEVAYHSHHMAEVEKEYREAISEIKVQSNTEGDFFSSVTGQKAAACDLGPDYWVSNMLNEVKFSQSLQQLCLDTSSGKKTQKRNLQSKIDDIIEVGPHSALAGPIKQIIQANEKLSSGSIAYHSVLLRNKNAVDTVLKLVSSLFTLGYPVNLSRVNRISSTEKLSVLVDLPPYAWNHSNTYWHESWKSKAYKNRPFPRTDLLGALERTCSPMEPRWANHIRLSEIPWVRDHVIQANIVYPAAGYIVMAIEAATQRAIQRSVPTIAGYNIREVVIGAALVIPENPGEVEVSVTLKSYSDSMTSPSDLWDEFIVSSVSGEDRWTEHCRGLIAIQTPPKSANVIDGESQKADDRRKLVSMINEYDEKCQKNIDVAQFYQTIARLGLEYGETFACMSQARAGPNTCVGNITIPDTAAVMPQKFQFSFIIHPATLDSLFHTIFVSLDADEMKDPAVPVSVEEIYVSNSITSTPGDKLVCYTSTQIKDPRTISASLTVLSAHQEAESEPVITIRGINCTTLGVAEATDGSSESQSRAYNFDWKADIDMLSADGLAKLLGSPPVVRHINIRHKFEVAAFYLLKSVIDNMQNSLSAIKTPYQQSLWALLNGMVKKTIDDNKGSLSEIWISASEDEQNDLLDKVQSYGHEGRTLYHIGERLPSLLKGEIEASSLLSEVDLSGFYSPSDMFTDSTMVSKYLEMMAFKQPNLSILACGKLSGFLSIPILAALESKKQQLPYFSKFEYADDDFDLANLVKAKCAKWNDLVTRKELDIEVDPAKQDVSLESYDVLIVFQPLGCEEAVRRTLENAHKLLKPGGKLLLVGRPMKSLAVSTMFGFLPSMLPGQAHSEDGDIILSDENWTKVLSETHYSQDVTIPNAANSTKHAAVFLTALTSKPTTPKYPNTLVILDGGDGNPAAQILKEQFIAHQIDADITSFEAATPLKDQVCILLSDSTSQTLINPSEKQWNVLKTLFLESGGVLWVTRGATALSSDPSTNLISGIARTVRSESGERPVLTLDLDAEKMLSDKRTAELIISLFERHFSIGTAPKGIEPEYAERNGILMIPRLIEDTELVKFVSTSTAEPKPELQKFRQPGRPLRMHVGTPGLLDSIYFVDDDRFEEDLPADWVQMEVKATGFNFKDVMTALGQIQLKSLGWEAGGVVTAVGKNITHLQVGDRVLSYGAGLFSTDYRGPFDRFHKIPDHLSFERAASLPVTYATAYYSCHYIAKLQKGETVLVHAASGGLGQAIIELCQLVGAEVYATVGTADKKQFLMDYFKIPEDHIFFSRNGSFAKGVKKMTQGRGVDVIMNSLAGENLRLTWDCIAPWGRFVELGQRDIMINTRLEMKPLSRNTTFSGFLLDDLFEQRPQVASKVIAEVIELFRTEAIRGPAQVHSYPISDVEKALRTMQTGGHMGKLVAINGPEDMVKVIPGDNTKSLLRSDASYMLVGGLGGIGRATALWMAEHGASNLILVSRSGRNNADAKDTVQALESNGVKVAVYSCDITDPAQMQSTVEQASQEMPPIKGVIQGAMVLRDILFQNMSLGDYKAVLNPKVQGTWNLHNALPKDMDFFVMESSVSGIIGNATQAAYAAGNTFLDSFASYRNSQGLPATTIDLGAISDVGYLATNSELREAMQRQGFELTDKKTLMSLLHFAIENPRRPALLSQCVTGLGVWNEGNSLDSLNLPLFAHFRSLTSQGSTDSGGAGSAGQLRKNLRKATTLEDASDIICTALVSKIASRAGVGVEHVNVGNPISDYGIDSLVAVEIRNWISKEMNSTIPILELLANTPLSQLATKIAQRSRLVHVNEGEKL